MISAYLESMLWILTIAFITIAICVVVVRTNKGIYRNATPFSIITIPICLTILFYFSCAFFLPQESKELGLVLVNVEGKGVYEKINGDKIRVNLYNEEEKTLGYLDLDKDEVAFFDTESPSNFKIVHNGYNSSIISSMLRFLENEKYELYLNKEPNMTALYKDNNLHLAGYSSDSNEELDKIKRELDSLENQLEQDEEK